MQTKDASQRPTRAGWLFVFPGLLAIAALTWAVVQPTEVCSFGSDTSNCADYSTMKFFVATTGVGLAVLIAAIVGLAIRLSRAMVAAAMAVGTALLALGVNSLIGSL